MKFILIDIPSETWFVVYGFSIISKSEQGILKKVFS